MGHHMMVDIDVMSGLGGGGAMPFGLPIPPFAPATSGRGGRGTRAATRGGNAGGQTGAGPGAGFALPMGMLGGLGGLMRSAGSGPMMMGAPMGLPVQGMPGLMELMSMLGGQAGMFGGRPMGKPACAKSFIDALPGDPPWPRPV